MIEDGKSGDNEKGMLPYPAFQVSRYLIRLAEIKPRARGVFDGLVIYINGSTMPAISDHKLKHLLAENGARLSISLGRRTVTHVILGNSGGGGGGLASSKIEKEIKRIGGCSVKYVTVEW